MKKYIFTYRYGGKSWGIEIFADSPDEAKDKMRAAANAQFEGEVLSKLYMPVKLSWLARFKQFFGKENSRP